MTAAQSYEDHYRCSTPRLHRRPYDAWGIAYRAVTWPFTAVHACFVAGSEPATRYKRRYSEVYSTLYATPAGPTHPFGRTSTGLAGRIDNGGRISRIRSSEAFKGGIR